MTKIGGRRASLGANFSFLGPNLIFLGPNFAFLRGFSDEKAPFFATFRSVFAVIRVLPLRKLQIFSKVCLWRINRLFRSAFPVGDFCASFEGFRES